MLYCKALSVPSNLPGPRLRSPFAMAPTFPPSISRLLRSTRNTPTLPFSIATATALLIVLAIQVSKPDSFACRLLVETRVHEKVAVILAPNSEGECRVCKVADSWSFFIDHFNGVTRSRRERAVCFEYY